MAEGTGGDDNSLPNGSFPVLKSKRGIDCEENDSDESINQPDLGLGNQAQSSKRITTECQSGNFSAKCTFYGRNTDLILQNLINPCNVLYILQRVNTYCWPRSPFPPIFLVVYQPQRNRMLYIFF